MSRYLSRNTLNKLLGVNYWSVLSHRKSSNYLQRQCLSPNGSKNTFFKSSLIIIVSIFGTNFLVKRFQKNKNNKSLTQLLPHFHLRRAQLFLKDNSNDVLNDESSPSKRFNFIADVTDKVSSALVFIDVHEKHPFFNVDISVSNGSGFIIDSSGLILTNAHVVANSRTVSVQLYDGRVLTGRVEYIDQRLDLAIISIDSKETLPFIRLGDSTKARVGEWVIAMGSPFSLSNTITVGVISTTNRKSHELGIDHKEIDYIQTDAAINIGNSGGPLVNLDGEAIGINTMKVTAGISFAIPSNFAKEFIERANRFRQKTPKAKTEEKLSKQNRYIGVTMLTLTPEIIQQFRSRESDFPDVKNGILIWTVVVGSPAYLEGVQPRDIITHINGESAHSVNDIYKALETEQSLKLTIRRKDREIKLVVKPIPVD